MSNTAIHTENAPAAIGPYSQAIQAGNTIYVSGQLPIDPATGAFAGADIAAQTRQSLTNIRSILAEAGYSMTDVVKTTVLLADIARIGQSPALHKRGSSQFSLLVFFWPLTWERIVSRTNARWFHQRLLLEDCEACLW